MPTPAKKKPQRRKGGRRPKIKGDSRVGSSTTRPYRRNETTYLPRRVGASAVDHPQRVKLGIATFIDRICDERGIDDFDELSPELRVHIAKEASELHDDHNYFEKNPEVQKIFDRLGGKVVAPDRRNVHVDAEIAAMRRTPFARAIRDVLGAPTTGKQVDRRKVVSLYERMIYGWDEPEIKTLHNDLCKPSPTTNFVYEGVQDCDEGQDMETIRKMFARMLSRHAGSADALIDQNLAIIKELAKTNPEIGKHCAVDGTIVPGAFDQRAAPSGTLQERVLLRGKAAGPIWHGDDFARGWYCVVITDIASGLPLVWRNFKGAQLKGSDVAKLVGDLQTRWEECPIETLVGDSEFSKSGELSKELVFCHDVQPIFPLRENSPRRSPYKDSLGTPRCCDEYMTLERPKGFVSRKVRKKRDLKPGETSEETARMVWECDHCANRANLYVTDDPLLHTMYPRRGTDDRALTRIALMRKRNIVESTFSQMKLRGKGLRESSAPKWMDEIWDCDWLIGGALFALTLNRYVHYTGLYAEIFVEMDDLELLPKT